MFKISQNFCVLAQENQVNQENRRVIEYETKTTFLLVWTSPSDVSEKPIYQNMYIISKTQLDWSDIKFKFDKCKANIAA